jgi:hypothetical protein
MAAEFLQGFAHKNAEPHLSTMHTPGGRASGGHGGRAGENAIDECAGVASKLCNLLEDDLASIAESTDIAARARQSAKLVEIRPWLRKSVERWLYGKVGPMLWRSYAGKHDSVDALYVTKRRALSLVSDEDLLEALEIPTAFRGHAAHSSQLPVDLLGTPPACLNTGEDLSEDETSSPGSACGASWSSNCSTAAETEDLSLRPRRGRPAAGHPQHPYRQAVQALQHVEAVLRGRHGHNSTPREALEALAMAQLEMKTCAFEASGGQSECCAMDDMLPLFIFVLVRSGVRHPLACARLLQDGLTQDEQAGGDGIATLLLESAARYVAEEWDIQDLLKSKEN